MAKVNVDTAKVQTTLAGRTGLGAIEVATGVCVDELHAPLPAPALAEDRRTPALHTGTQHPAVRATSGGFGTKALSGVSCGDWLTGDLSQHDPHCSRCRQHTPASSARSPPA